MRAGALGQPANLRQGGFPERDDGPGTANVADCASPSLVGGPHGQQKFHPRHQSSPINGRSGGDWNSSQLSRCSCRTFVGRGITRTGNTRQAARFTHACLYPATMPAVSQKSRHASEFVVTPNYRHYTWRQNCESCIAVIARRPSSSLPSSTGTPSRRSCLQHTAKQ